MITLEMAIQKIQQFSPEQRNEVIKFIEFIDFKTNQDSPNKTATTLETPKISFAEAAQEFMGCLDSDLEDLSYNPKHLEGFGQ